MAKQAFPYNTETHILHVVFTCGHETNVHIIGINKARKEAAWRCKQKCLACSQKEWAEQAAQGKGN